MNPLAQTREPEPTLIDLSGDVETQCRHLGYFRDAALVQAQDADTDFMAEFWLSEARLYAFEIETARQANSQHSLGKETL